MNYQNVFKRYELKYLIHREQYDAIKEKIQDYMVPDQCGRTTICNIYFDTPNDLLVRRSIEKPLYKEKLRLRSYGTPKEDSTVYVELKKKYNSVVYKRRTDMTYHEAMEFLLEGKQSKDSQIIREMNYFLSLYKGIRPAEVISYEREAFYGKDDNEKTLRITIPEDLNYTNAFDEIMEQYTSKVKLISVKSTNLGSMFKIHYNITLKNPKEEKAFIDALRTRNGNLEIVLSKQEDNIYEL